MSTPSTFNDDLSYSRVGKDISCNLGSLNIAKTMDTPDFGADHLHRDPRPHRGDDQTAITSVPSIEEGNNSSQLVTRSPRPDEPPRYLARERIFYGSEEGIDFTNIYFYTVLFHALRASNAIARERGRAFGVREVEVRQRVSSSTSTPRRCGSRPPSWSGILFGQAGIPTTRPRTTWL